MPPCCSRAASKTRVASPAVRLSNLDCRLASSCRVAAWCRGCRLRVPIPVYFRTGLSPDTHGRSAIFRVATKAPGLAGSTLLFPRHSPSTGMNSTLSVPCWALMSSTNLY